MPTRRELLRQTLLAGIAAATNPLAGQEHASLTFACAADNDLYHALAAGPPLPRYDSAAEAIATAPRGSGVLLLADSYPTATNALEAALFRDAERKELRLYVEFPSSIPSLEVGSPRSATVERAVVASNAFQPKLDRLRILAIHDCHFVPVKASGADLVLARVAGFDRAVYGLPEKDVYPILFEHAAGRVLVATTKLSQFVTARYAPADAWGPIWKRVFSWLIGGSTPKLAWRPTVRPTFGPADRLPHDVELRSFERGAAWYRKAKLFPGPPDKEGALGVLEGIGSRIRFDGRQPVQPNLRTDCAGETSFAMALAGEPSAAANLNEFIYFNSVVAQGPRNDPRSASFGLLSWSTKSADIYYGDDNARSLLGTIGAAAVLKSDRWDRLVLRCLLANLRTTGSLGFRGNRLDDAALDKNGWQYYFNREITNYAPHYEAYLWACFLWAYHKTRYQPFLDRARNAIRMTVDAYPDQWHWTNGIQQERARMILPAAWLVRVEDTPEHREWLRKIATELLKFQQPCGAIREEIGTAGKGKYAPPKSNEAYGTAEAPLIQENGDPLADLLYTTNFAFLGLHEAAAATRERLYSDAEAKLAKFLTRIQISSEARPELDGGWFRAFEFRRWDYWGSDSDRGWGAWSIETGWTQAWIVSVLGMRQRNTSLWDLTVDSRIGGQLKTLLPEMFPTSVTG